STNILYTPYLLLFIIQHQPTNKIYTLSLHDALPILNRVQKEYYLKEQIKAIQDELGEGEDILSEVDNYKKEINKISMSEEVRERSEEHTSELQSRFDLVCRLLLEKKNKRKKKKKKRK